MTGRNDLDTFFAIQENAGKNSIKLGFPQLDNHIQGYGVPEDTLIYLMGKSGVGKSWFLLNVFKSLLDRKKKTLFFSFEMNITKVYYRLLQLIYKLNIDEAIKFSKERKDEIRKLFNEREYTKNSLTVTDIQDYQGMRKYIGSNDWDFILVDHLYLIRNKGIDGVSRTVFNCQHIFDLKKEFKKRFLVLVQVKRGKERAHDGSYPPQIEDARGASQIEDDSDLLMGMWRPDIDLDCKDEEKGIIKIRYLKIRIPSPKADNMANLLKYDKITGIIDPKPLYNI